MPSGRATVAASALASGRTANVTVHNPDPKAADSSPASLPITYPAPTLTAVAPVSVATGFAATITLTGTGFTANASVLWNGSARSTTYVSAISLKVALSAADLGTAGTGQITVTNPAPGCGTTATQTLNIVTPPSITSVDPTTLQVPASSSIATPLIINGANFASNATAMLNGYKLTNSDE